MSRLCFQLMTAALLLPALVQAGGGEDPRRLVERYRQTESPAVLEECRAALRRSPLGTNARFAAARLDLLTGRTKEALDAALRLNHEAPDDLDTYGLLVDAYRKLGRLEDAEKAAQWMLDLRPWDLRGLTRAAALRDDFGDTTGAIELYTECFQKAFPTDTVMRADILTALARLDRKTGHREEADRLLADVRKMAPDYRPAQRMLEEQK